MALALSQKIRAIKFLHIQSIVVLTIIPSVKHVYPLMHTLFDRHVIRLFHQPIHSVIRPIYAIDLTRYHDQLSEEEIT